MKLICIIILFFSLSYLSYAEVNFTSPFLPDENTLALWHFDQDAGDTVVYDASGNRNDGTLITELDKELDRYKTWQKSMPGFGFCISTYWDSPTFYNVGVIKVPQNRDHNFLSIFDKIIYASRS